jgi:primosomal protein N' (replication factor Y)
MSAPPGRFVEVALPLPLYRTFTYSVDGEQAERLLPGTRVVVPVRNKRVIGVCLGQANGAGVERPRPVLDVPDAEPALGSAMLELCRWMAEYYVVPIGLVLRCVLPALLTGVDTPRPTQKSERVAVIARELPSLRERDELFGRAKRQRELYEVLEGMGGQCKVAHLSAKLGFSPGVIQKLAERGLIAIQSEVVSRDPFATRDSGPPARHTPTRAQRAAIDALVAGRAGDVFLLRGITGSGKTLVYVELLREIVERRGQTAIVLVPEIALTPQTVDRFRSVFGNRVAVLHSAAAWREAHRRRRAVGRLRAAGESRRDRRGRGARGELQER